MNALSPLETLFSVTAGNPVPLTPELERLYGPLTFPFNGSKPLMVGNFVSTLDGVVSFGIPGKAGGRAISGSSEHDRLVMGLLRSVADTVIVSAGSFRASRTRMWNAGAAYAPLADDLARVRIEAGKPIPPLTVIVTATGKLGDDWTASVSAANPYLILTTPDGARNLAATQVPQSAQIRVAGHGRLSAGQVLAAIERERPSRFVLIEAGPQLMGDFVRERRLDDLFLTVAPQIAGRDDGARRPGFVSGTLFGPDDPRWGTLVDVRRAGSHLFLRYGFTRRHAMPSVNRRSEVHLHSTTAFHPV